MSDYVLIPLSGKYGKGRRAIVDTADHRLVENYSWYVKASGHLQAHVRGSKPYRTVFMHHLILPVPTGHFTDHINRNPLDNRRSNLRIVTKQQNQQNQGPYRKARSKYKGVSLHNASGRWRALIRHEGRQISLGYFDSEEPAARAYDAAAAEAFGEYAYLNFPD